MNLIRKVVSGKRNRYQDGEFDLDLTAITNRVYAMAIPAEDPVQKLYRNPMGSVASYLRKVHHSKFWIFNISGKVYDKSLFAGRVSDYDWEDHQNPGIFLVLNICEAIY